MNKQLITSVSILALGLALSSCGGGSSNDDTSQQIDESVQRKPDQVASDLMLLAGGLSAEILTRDIGNKADMMSFWPAGNSPTHLIACIEGGVEDLANGKKNPSLQSVDLNSGDIKTILRGMDRCDGVRTTAWGTVLATEESGDGAAYEILDPLNVSEHTVTNREAGTIIDDTGAAATKIIKRPALPVMAWEGLTVLENGVVIAGDELRPGSYEDSNGSEDTDGGSIFKFVPNALHNGGVITDLANSPLAAGKTYAMQVQCRDGESQHGQGCEIGNAIWVEVDPSNARVDANTKEATGYYRPEDLHADPSYSGTGVRFCWTNTGNEGASNYGEVICGVDTDPENVAPSQLTVVNRFVEGDADFNAHDNLAFQPVSGNLYVIEDHKNGDVFACLPDGNDRDNKTDGCVRVLSLHDASAEPTGFLFSPDGKSAYVNVQHSNDKNIANVDGYGTDDLVKITGFSVPNKATTIATDATRQASLHTNAATYFGFSGAKTASFNGQVNRVDANTAADAIELADSLSATFLTRNAGNKTDMMEFWPAGNNPTHLITCVEGGVEDLNGAGKLNPSVQRISLANGTVTTMVRGMSRCDGIRTTDWGTVLATEEAGDGAAYEILNPLSVTEHTITSRENGTIVDDNNNAASNVVKRIALPVMAWEGLTVLPNGVVIGGDELRPGSYEDANGSEDTDGGALFKFVPATPRTGTSTITDLADSPLVAGKTYALQVQCREGESQHGQGCEIGNGIWVEVDPVNARTSANTNEATGYYRPEDLHADPTYSGAGVRFCWANTGNEGASNYGEVICGIDIDPTNVSPEQTTVVNRFIEGDTDMNALDNLAFQPISGNLYVIEDHSNGDVWACLPDGADRNIKSDGCIRLFSVKDQSAEPTGFTFSPDGKTAYVSIQHSDDTGIPLLDDYATDDIIKIEGFSIPNLASNDFGKDTEDSLINNAQDLFGFGTPVPASSTGQ